MKIRIQLTIFSMCLFVGCSGVGGKDFFQPTENVERTWTSLERSTVSAAHINWSNASAPFNKYLLIRDGEFLCALRFINYVRGQNARPGSFWSSGEETLTAAYEWNLLRSVDGKLSTVDHGNDIVQFTAPKGFGHLIVGGGYGNVKCGDRKLGWQYPNGINFSQESSPNRRLAPTRWDRISDIKVDDAKLLWYSFDPKRKSITVRIDDLPG